MKGLPVRVGICLGLGLLGAVLTVSCSTSGPPPRPNAFMARNANTKLDTLQTGYETYVQRCTSCHDSVPVPRIGRMWHTEDIGPDLYLSLTDLQRYAVSEYLKGVDATRLKADLGALQDSR